MVVGALRWASRTRLPKAAPTSPGTEPAAQPAPSAGKACSSSKAGMCVAGAPPEPKGTQQDRPAALHPAQEARVTCICKCVYFSSRPCTTLTDSGHLFVDHSKRYLSTPVHRSLNTLLHFHYMSIGLKSH